MFGMVDAYRTYVYRKMTHNKGECKMTGLTLVDFELLQKVVGNYVRGTKQPDKAHAERLLSMLNESIVVAKTNCVLVSCADPNSAVFKKGRYMGMLKGLSQEQRDAVKNVRREHGIDAALARLDDIDNT